MCSGSRRSFLSRSASPSTPSNASALGKVTVTTVSSPEEWQDFVLADCRDCGGVLKPGDTYGITCGEPMGYPGGTNMLKVCRVG